MADPTTTRGPEGGWRHSAGELDEAGVCALAQRLGGALRGGDVVLLHGDMGAGKTTFTRALARGLGVRRPDRVCSPTFALCVEHEGPHPLVHIDLCRLGELGPGPPAGAAFEALGLQEQAQRARQGACVLVVEWAQHWAAAPGDALRIELALAREPCLRRVELQGAGPLAERVAALVG